MRLGFNLLLWTTFVTEKDHKVLAALKEAGYDGVEIPLFEGGVDHYEALGKVLSDLGLGVTTVTVMPPGKSCVVADAGVRQAGYDHIKWAIDCTAAMSGEVLAGPIHQTLGEFTGSGPTESEVSYCAEVHRKAAETAAASKVTLSVEPLNRFECYFLNTAAQAVTLCEMVGAANYGYLYDTFHFNIEENDLVDIIAPSVKHMSHVHISENTRGTPGDGHVDFNGVIGALAASGYDGWMTCEAFGSALPDLAAATKIWRPLFDKPEDVYLGALKTMREGLAAAGKG